MTLASKSVLAALATLALAAAAQTPDTRPQPPAPVVRPRPVRPVRPAAPAAAQPPAYQDAYPALRNIRPLAPLGSTGATAPAPRRAPAGATGPIASTPRTSATASTGASGSTAPHRLAPATAAPGASAQTTAHTPHPATGASGSTAPRPIPASSAATTPKPVSSTPAAAPTPSVPAGPVYTTLNRTVIVLDPAHGGTDSGSRIADNLVEKDLTLALAFKLRSLLQARGFTVVLTREADANGNDAQPAPLSLDDRAGIANHARAAACLLLHATGAGAGVHLYHSDLAPAPGEAATLPWLTAQSAWVNQSSTLSGQLAQALTRSGLAVVNSTASVRPVDSLTCPALVVELAPRSAGDTGTLEADGYQNTVAQALAGALVFWKEQAKAPEKLQPIPDAATKSSPPHPVISTEAKRSGETCISCATAPRPKPKPAAPAVPIENRND